MIITKLLSWKQDNNVYEDRAIPVLLLIVLSASDQEDNVYWGNLLGNWKELWVIREDYEYYLQCIR